MAQALPFLSLGLGAYSTIKGEQRAAEAQQAAREEANKPRLSEAERTRLRSEGQSNIRAEYAKRGLSDSSLVGGAFSDLETRIAEAASPSGRTSQVPGMLWEEAVGRSQAGAEAFGGLSQFYMLSKLLNEKNRAAPTLPGLPPTMPPQPNYPNPVGWNKSATTEPLRYPMYFGFDY